MNPLGENLYVDDEIPGEDIQEQLMLQTGADRMEIYSTDKFSMVGKLIYVGKGVWKIYASHRVWVTFHKDDVLKVNGLYIQIKDRD